MSHWMNVRNWFGKKNSLSVLLDSLEVKHTPLFVSTLLDKYANATRSIQSLSKLLEIFFIETAAVFIDNKNEMAKNLHLPYVAQFKTENVTVVERSESFIIYWTADKKHKVPYEEFCNNWTGLTLLVEKQPESKEPDYKEHLTKYLFTLIVCMGILMGLSVLFVAGFIYAVHLLGWRIVFPFLLNVGGLFVSILLLSKQLKKDNTLATQVCRAFTKTDGCKGVLETKASTIGGVISWSEIGLGYFVANLILMSAFPLYYMYVIGINVCVLPFSFWSIWYQKAVAKQWCPLCLLVQLIIWSLFAVNLFWIKPIDLHFKELVLIGCCYIVLPLLVNRIVLLLTENIKLKNAYADYHILKLNETVFNALLVEQTHYKVDKAASSILLGNKSSSQLLTVVSNPFCNSCAFQHQFINELLIQNKICIQYFFYSFSENTEVIDKLLIGYYLKEADVIRVYSDWFSLGINNPPDFTNKYPLEIEGDTGVEEEYDRQRGWIEREHIVTTPTILLNGYKLPYPYTLEDLKML